MMIGFFIRPVLPRLYTLAVLLEQAGSGRIGLDEDYVLRAEDKYVQGTRVEGSGILKGMKPGKIYSYRELAYLMITASDNVAANIILDRIGFPIVNKNMLKYYFL
ncbi:serine hydrolase [Thermosyntropha lipolytica]|nr:serine hydrolase [Thermosyntropha lipolytica]